MIFSTEGNKTLRNKNAQDMATVTNRGTIQIRKQAIMEKWIKNAIIRIWITLIWQLLNFFL